jgi:nucleoside-diphosphate kinase
METVISATAEKTFALIKPDAVMAGATGAIIKRIEDSNFYVEALGKMQMSLAQVRMFYKEHEGKPFYAPLVDFMACADIVALVLVREDAVAKWRSLMGATDPTKAEPCTLRELYGTKMPRNAVHGSDSVDSACREIRLFQSFVHPLWSEVKVP